MNETKVSKAVAGLGLSMETIQFQHGTQLYSELVKITTDFQRCIVNRQKLNLKALIDTVRELTGLFIDVEIVNSPGCFMMTSPLIGANNPIMDEPWRDDVYGRTGAVAARLAKIGEKFNGAVDLEKCRVSGIFSSVSCGGLLTMDINLMDPQSGWTPENLAGVILHELGHLFTYFTYLGHTALTDTVVHHAIKGVLGTESKSERVVILTAAEHALGIQLEDKETLSESNVEDAYGVVLVTARIRKTYVVNGSLVYAARIWEQLADQFAVRHGGGLGLGAGLVQMSRTYGTYTTNTQREFTALYIAAMAVVGAATFTAGGWVLTLPLIGSTVISLFTDSDNREYDERLRRLDKLVLEMTAALKERKLPEKAARRYIEDIGKLRALVQGLRAEGVTDRTDRIQIIVDYVVPSKRRRATQVAMQKAMEDLANNSLFYRAAQIQQGT